ncbi:cbb3-type cytochrome oxidase assembly protein CcoS [Mesorhizobium sp. SARCC-RB16n]|uniref:cbb3-type cytochrome oxidase assembly protein CcoS n=1 Tax=Mesorhizobium sp. SARCC-RB16n TaxID=2116687 RepID=UPI00122EA847|nr:cbb3-type cytochrome oxidase assembly protein CcoS [Mesorhizobium sp. SARCC-RB16n]KAA3448382.1 cbb3-type cytochrome oxidase assembly protein CcoS [Mesorhizobium sp. SARCC-RB16n]
MTTLVYLIPVALFLGALGLAGFLWAVRSGQYEDLDGAAERILIDRDDEPDGLTRRANMWN